MGCILVENQTANSILHGFVPSWKRHDIKILSVLALCSPVVSPHNELSIFSTDIEHAVAKTTEISVIWGTVKHTWYETVMTWWITFTSVFFPQIKILWPKHCFSLLRTLIAKDNNVDQYYWTKSEILKIFPLENTNEKWKHMHSN